MPHALHTITNYYYMNIVSLQLLLYAQCTLSIKNQKIARNVATS